MSTTPTPTREEMLKAVIEKAVKNGFQNGRFNRHYDYHVSLYEDAFYSILFNKDFAKAFWGENKVCSNCGGLLYVNMEKDLEYCDNDCDHFFSRISWQYHLQQAVLSEDPISYYFQFV